jgi:NADH-quinone oxidoreductase subunit H
MAGTLDQIFVIVKQGLVDLGPAPWRPWISALISIATIIAAFASLFALTTILERKGLGRIQNRLGPNRVGPFGLLQPLADGVKSLTKEDLVPRSADQVLHFLAPLVLVVPVFLALAVIPVGRNMVAVDLDAGVVFFFAVGAATELSVFMAGWSSRNKYSLLGAMRALAQMISYEIPLILAALPVIMISGSLSTVRIVEMQAGFTGLLPDWNVLTPWGFAAFFLFLIAGTAEANRSPFDLPEGESEIIAGYYIEYSGFKFALFFLGEYIGLFAMSGLAITLFLGGWAPPLSGLDFIPSYVWFFGKLLGLIALFIWVRGTLPRLRMDQLMGFAWKFMVPMSLVTILSAVVWHYMGPGVPRWLVCSFLVIAPYMILGTFLYSGRNFGKRVYRYAD